MPRTVTYLGMLLLAAVGLLMAKLGPGFQGCGLHNYQTEGPPGRLLFPFFCSLSLYLDFQYTLTIISLSFPPLHLLVVSPFIRQNMHCATLCTLSICFIMFQGLSLHCPLNIRENNTILFSPSVPLLSPPLPSLLLVSFPHLPPLSCHPHSFSSSVPRVRWSERAKAYTGILVGGTYIYQHSSSDVMCTALPLQCRHSVCLSTEQNAGACPLNLMLVSYSFGAPV